MSGCAGFVPPAASTGSASSRSAVRDADNADANLSGAFGFRLDVDTSEEGSCTISWSFEAAQPSDSPDFMAWATVHGQMVDAGSSRASMSFVRAHAAGVDTQPVTSSALRGAPFSGARVIETSMTADAVPGEPASFHVVVPELGVPHVGGRASFSSRLTCTAPIANVTKAASREPRMLGGFHGQGGAGVETFGGPSLTIMDRAEVTTNDARVEFLLDGGTGKGTYELATPNGTKSWTSTPGLSPFWIHETGGAGTWKFQATEVAVVTPYAGVIVPFHTVGSWKDLERQS